MNADLNERSAAGSAAAATAFRKMFEHSRSSLVSSVLRLGQPRSVHSSPPGVGCYGLTENRSQHCRTRGDEALIYADPPAYPPIGASLPRLLELKRHERRAPGGEE
jgi:hypothetical protein